jgi:hypothetical protein
VRGQKAIKTFISDIKGCPIPMQVFQEHEAIVSGTLVLIHRFLTSLSFS